MSLLQRRVEELSRLRPQRSQDLTQLGDNLQLQLGGGDMTSGAETHCYRHAARASGAASCRCGLRKGRHNDSMQTPIRIGIRFEEKASSVLVGIGI